MKKGDIWVAAALYIALGIVLIAIVLSATLPLLEKLKDRNTFIQTRDILFDVDQTIRETFEGPGSQREITIEIQRGDFIIDFGKDNINWTLKTTAKLIEPNPQPIPSGKDLEFKEGNLIKKAYETRIENEYLLSIWLPYDEDQKPSTIGDRIANLVPEKDKPNILNIKGTQRLLIRNNPVAQGETPEIEIRLL